MSDPIKTIPTSKEADQIRELSANAADRTRIAGLELAAGLDDALAESAQLEAARLRFKHGKGEEVPAVKAAEQLSETYKRRSEAFKIESDQSRTSLELELKRDEGGDDDGGDDNDNDDVRDPTQPPVEERDPFKLGVRVVRGEKGVSGVSTELAAGQKVLDTQVTNTKGAVVFAIDPKTFASIRAVTDRNLDRGLVGLGPAVERRMAQLSVIVRDKNAKIIGKGSLNADVVSGGSAELTVKVG
ncbi:hypothetical protein [Nitratireductor sp. XY-223]|uniref:hypothetical protein n=1 Tax=Nitratireductor sp. XY-223 TaxID=2561926 RepID=UPI0010AA8526|nr:hypothetical protein [Nitratireductor sp. XY-223]